jgi:hypothetical protein
MRRWRSAFSKAAELAQKKKATRRTMRRSVPEPPVQRE